MSDELAITIASDVDVVSARQRGRELAEEVGFSAGDQTVIAAAISEIARNILNYARRGAITFRIVLDGDRSGIIIVASDQGPGIPDVPRAMQDGFSTSGGLGLGLPGARRLMDEFEVVSAPRQGTTITMKKWKRAQRAQPGETASGDLALVEPFAGGVLAAVVDALGHGSEAATTARQAITALERVPSEPVADLLRRCHEALLGFRGAVVSLASFDTLRATMTWLGVGNVEGVLLLADQTLQPSRTTLVTFGGIVGAELPRARAWIVPVSPGDTLIFATDGIRTGFADDLTPTGSPQQIADGILARHAKGTDDALVLVARYIGGERRTR